LSTVPDVQLAERALRADAQRNLGLILEAAAAAFAEDGLDAGVADIARRAGVGQATIFRRFETKEDLIAAVVESKMGSVIEAARESLDTRRAWDGLRAFMEAATELNMRDRGLFEAVAERLMRDPRFLERHEQLMEIVGELVARAKAEGDLRKDVCPQDIPVLVCAAAQAGATVDSAGSELWRRYLQVVIDGLRAQPGRSRLKPAPPDWDLLRAALKKPR
jgi:AcrR family transcriptional regulator